MIRGAVAEVVIVGVVIVGEFEKTRFPVPVSSESESIRYCEVPELVNCPPVVVNKAREAVRPEKVMVPEDVRPVAAAIAPLELT
jgi:hypothetical protein